MSLNNIVAILIHGPAVVPICDRVDGEMKPDCTHSLPPAALPVGPPHPPGGGGG